MRKKDLNYFCNQILAKSSKSFNSEEKIREYRKLNEEYNKTHDENIKQQAQQIKDEIVYNNIPLIIKIARKYEFPARMDISDLISVGTIALIRSIDKYDLQGTNKFSTYAGDSAVNEILEEINKSNGTGNLYYGRIITTYMKIAIATFGDNNSIYEEENIDYILNIMLDEDLIRPGSLEEIKIRILSQIDVDEETVENIMYDNSIDDDLETNYIETNFIKKHKKEIFSTLTDYQKDVVEYVCGFKDGHPYSKKKVAEIYGVSRQAISEQYDKALKKMRKVFN